MHMHATMSMMHKGQNMMAHFTRNHEYDAQGNKQIRCTFNHKYDAQGTNSTMSMMHKETTKCDAKKGHGN